MNRREEREREWATLYEAHGPSAKRLAFLLMGEDGLADDLVQDAFVRIFSRPRSFHAPASFDAYLRKTIVNLARDRGRRKVVEGAYVSSLRIEYADSNRNLETRDEMWNALRALPSRQRTAIVLRIYEDLSEAETAELMQCSVGAVKSYLSRGLKKLRESIDKGVLNDA